MNLKDINDPLVIDEAAFPYGASAILENGDPFFYNGETRPRDLALWHPPLYVYSLALHMLFWGTSIFSVRFFGIFCVLLTLVISFFILKRLTLNKQEWLISINIFTLLYLFNPLMSESALVPDIDGTIAMPIIAGGLLHCVNLSKNKWTKIQFLWSIIFWVLIFSTKFTIAVLFIPIYLVLILTMVSRPVLNLFVSFSAILLGFFVFIFSWRISSILLDIPFRPPFDYFVYSLNRKSGGDNSFVNYFNSATSFDNRVLSWLGPSLLILFLLVSFFNFTNLSRNASKNTSLLFSFFAIYTLLIYNIFGGLPFTFPKYWVISVLPICLVVALFSASIFLKTNIALRSFDFRLIDLIVTVVLILVISINYSFARKLDANFGYSPISYLQYSLVTSVLFFLLISIFLFCHSGIKIFRNTLYTILYSSLLASVIFFQFSTFALHRNAKYSTTYYFGEIGLKETILKVRNLTDPDDLILAAKDVGLQAERPFIEDALVVGMDEDQLSNYLSELPIQLVVTRNRFDYSESVYPNYFSVLRLSFNPIVDDSTTDFVVWVPKTKIE